MLHQKLSFNFIETQCDNNPLMETFMCPPIIHLLDKAQTNIQNYHACKIDSGTFYRGKHSKVGAAKAYYLEL